MLACTGGEAGDRGCSLNSGVSKLTRWLWVLEEREDWRVEILVCSLTEETKVWIPSAFYLFTPHRHPLESFILPSLIMSRCLFSLRPTPPPTPHLHLGYHPSLLHGDLTWLIICLACVSDFILAPIPPGDTVRILPVSSFNPVLPLYVRGFVSLLHCQVLWETLLHLSCAHFIYSRPHNVTPFSLRESDLSPAKSRRFFSKVFSSLTSWQELT